MTDITYAKPSEMTFPSSQSHFLEDQLEHLWLLTALESGIAQAKRGETVVADKAFFDALQARLFGSGKEDVIQA